MGMGKWEKCLAFHKTAALRHLLVMILVISYKSISQKVRQEAHSFVQFMNLFYLYVLFYLCNGEGYTNNVRACVLAKLINIPKK